VTDADGPITPELEADDLAALIAAAGGGPAEVFGTSGGAVAALALAVRHPAAVRAVLAHEPPIGELLPDAEHIRAAVDAVEAAYRAHGSPGAWGGFIALVMHQGELTAAGPDPAPFPPPAAEPPPSDDTDPDREPAGPPAPSAKQQADDRTFFLRMLTPFARHRPDVAALRAAPARIVVAVGAGSGQEVPRRSAEALAGQLGTQPVFFPGHHAGFLDDPDAFAAAVRAALAAG
jgi:pimeloyl-ACP methyl ester carboxylesterase